jgi:hypothetical protein
VHVSIVTAGNPQLYEMAARMVEMVEVEEEKTLAWMIQVKEGESSVINLFDSDKELEIDYKHDNVMVGDEIKSDSAMKILAHQLAKKNRPLLWSSYSITKSKDSNVLTVEPCAAWKHECKMMSEDEHYKPCRVSFTGVTVMFSRHHVVRCFSRIRSSADDHTWRPWDEHVVVSFTMEPPEAFKDMENGTRVYYRQGLKKIQVVLTKLEALVKCRTCEGQCPKDWKHCRDCQKALNAHPLWSLDLPVALSEQLWAYTPCAYNYQCGVTDIWCDDCHGDGAYTPCAYNYQCGVTDIWCDDCHGDGPPDDYSV